MKPIAAMMLVAGLSGETAMAKVPPVPGNVEAGRRVTVCADDIRDPQIEFGTKGASAIFANIGIELQWYFNGSCPPSPDAIHVEFSYKTLEALRPGALAYAFPFEGTRVVVLQDRVRAKAASRSLSLNRLLAYVLAHEITHVLQGLDTHAAEGIMKAHLNEGDFFLMMRNRLRFTGEDAERIYRGLDARRTRLMGAAAPKMPSVD